jgi:predicted metal-binding membrane protein
MGHTHMAGGSAMPTVWMRGASFVAMWVVMMALMMAPSFTPVLWRYARSARGANERRVGGLTALVALGYLFAWTVVGVIVFPVGAALARVHPLAIGVVLIIAGALQRTSWKARQLALCGSPPANLRAPWRYGLRLGVRCISSCAGLTAVMLVLGSMDLRVMIAVGCAITAERLAPSGVRVARVVGGIVAAGGFYLIAMAPK